MSTGELAPLWLVRNMSSQCAEYFVKQFNCLMLCSSFLSLYNPRVDMATTTARTTTRIGHQHQWSLHYDLLCSLHPQGFDGDWHHCGDPHRTREFSWPALNTRDHTHVWDCAVCAGRHLKGAGSQPSQHPCGRWDITVCIVKLDVPRNTSTSSLWSHWCLQVGLAQRKLLLCNAVTLRECNS